MWCHHEIRLEGGAAVTKISRVSVRTVRPAAQSKFWGPDVTQLCPRCYAESTRVQYIHTSGQLELSANLSDGALDTAWPRLNDHHRNPEALPVRYICLRCAH